MTNAYKAWNNVWLSETKHDWKDADPFVTRAIPIFSQKRYKKILDIGCGIGRHSLLFEQCGFKTTALDGSTTIFNLLIIISKESIISSSLTNKISFT